MQIRCGVPSIAPLAPPLLHLHPTCDHLPRDPLMFLRGHGTTFARRTITAPLRALNTALVRCQDELVVIRGRVPPQRRSNGTIVLIRTHSGKNRVVAPSIRRYRGCSLVFICCVMMRFVSQEELILDGEALINSLPDVRFVDREVEGRQGAGSYQVGPGLVWQHVRWLARVLKGLHALCNLFQMPDDQSRGSHCLGADNGERPGWWWGWGP